MALPAFKLLTEKIIAIAAATIPKKTHIITPPQVVTKNAYGLIIVQIQNLGNFLYIIFQLDLKISRYQNSRRSHNIID
jgi:hypothetical protein